MTDSEVNRMKIGAETASSATRKKLIQGWDGAGWARAVKENPDRSVPNGAAYLIVKHYEDLLGG